MMDMREDIVVAWEDAGLLAVIKPQGLATGLGEQDNLCARLFAERPILEKVKGFREGEGGLLHRLDNATGGLVLFAKTSESFTYYSGEMQQDRVIKRYCAICAGKSDRDEGIVTIPIAHHATKKNRMTRADRGSLRGKPQPTRTSWKIRGQKRGLILVEATITRGVRHQIRVHLSLTGMPIAGDRLYRNADSSRLLDDPVFAFHALYCFEVSLNLMDGKPMAIKTECPLRALWDKL